MKFERFILIIILVSIFTDLMGQTRVSLTPSLYSVDKQLSLTLNKFAWVDTGTFKDAMTIKVFWNNNTFFNQSLDCVTKSFIRNDSISISGFMTGSLGWGFQLVLFKDSCIAASFGLSDGKIYKYNKSDSDSTDFIILPNIYQKVILSKYPSYQRGEIIAGEIELKSAPYYYTTLDGKFRIELKAYFKTAPLEEIH